MPPPKNITRIITPITSWLYVMTYSHCFLGHNGIIGIQRFFQTAEFTPSALLLLILGFTCWALRQGGAGTDSAGSEHGVYLGSGMVKGC